MKRRTGWRRVEKKVGVAQRDAQHRQLQARDLARHLRRHARVGEDLVEQAADDVDHHVIELAGRGLDQLFAVGADQVDGHQAGEAVVVWPRRRRRPMPAPLIAPPAAAAAEAAVDHRATARGIAAEAAARRDRAFVGAADAAAGRARSRVCALARQRRSRAARSTGPSRLAGPSSPGWLAIAVSRRSRVISCWSAAALTRARATLAPRAEGSGSRMLSIVSGRPGNAVASARRCAASRSMSLPGPDVDSISP